AGVAANTLVLHNKLLAAIGIAPPGRNDLIPEGAGVGRSRRLLVTAKSEFILLASCDAILGREILRRESHAEDGRAMALVDARTRIKAGFQGDMVHVLHAAGDLDVLAARGDALRRLMNRLKPRATVAVDRGARQLDRKAGDEHG